MNLGTIVRLLAIALGIMSAVLLARSAFDIGFNEDFLSFLDILREIVGVAVTPVEILIVKPAVKWLRDHGAVVELQDHWKSAFVLLWLYFGSFARAAYGEWRERVFLTKALIWCWSGVCALMAGALTGTVSMSDPAVFWWPASGHFLWLTGNSVQSATFNPRGSWSWFGWFSVFGLPTLFLAAASGLLAVLTGKLALAANPTLFWCPFLCLSLYTVIERALWNEVAWPYVVSTFLFAAPALSVFPELSQFFESSRSPGLTTLFAVVCILGLERLIPSSLDEKGISWNPNSTSMGLDMLSVLAGAATIVYIGHVLA